MSQVLYHVTQSDRVPSILAQGLLLDPVARNFDCHGGIYFAKSVDDAKRWSGEIARQHGETLPMTILSVRVESTTIEQIDTFLNVAQVTTNVAVPSANITPVENFNASPVETHSRWVTVAGAGWWFEFCETLYTNLDTVVEHCEMMDEEGVF